MWQWLWYFAGALLTLILTLYTFYKYITGNKDYWPSRNVFYLNMSKVVPAMDRWTLRVPFHEMDNKMYRAVKAAGVKDFAGIMEFRSPCLVAVNLDLIKAITVKDFDHFVNRRSLISMKKTDPLFHDMLINKESQEWKDLRSTLSPTFTTGKIKRMFAVFDESSDKLAKFFDAKLAAKSGGQGQDDGGVDFRDGITRYTMDVIASAVFGIDSRIFEDDNADFSKWGKRLQNQFSGIKFLKLILAMLAPKLLEFFRIPVTDKEAVDFFAGVLSETIKRREESGEKRNDFVQLMIEAKRGELKEETDKPDKLDSFEKDAQLTTKAGKTPLTHDLILSQALLFFVAGFDTTETLLIFAVYEMALNPEVQEQLFQEVDEAMANNGGKLTYEDVNRLEYLDKVISETLRKYPPAIRTERKCTQDYKLPNSDVVLKKDSVVIIPMYGIHHDEDYYPDPEKFDPERFSPEAKAARHPYAYFPFGTGPRNCIAMRFALIEGKAALAHLIHKFKIEPSSKTHIPLKFAKIAGFKPESMFLKVNRR